MKIIVGTKNQKKIDVVVSVFKEVLGIDNLEIVAHNAESKVPEAPHGHETYDGALNRAMECYTIGSADYYIGIESGLVKRYGNLFEEAWAVIILKDGTNLVGYSSGLLLPLVVTNRMKNGEKHNDIMSDFDKIFNLPDDNRDTWSRYTGGNISRQTSLQESLRNALIQTVTSERNLYRYKSN
jgi:inosine/xanthosine triphosphatase